MVIENMYILGYRTVILIIYSELILIIYSEQPKIALCKIVFHPVHQLK
jgi:hypothetical protein